MEISAIGSTTHRDSHGDKLIREELENMAFLISSDSKPWLTEEHDLTLPPLGQWRKASVEPTEDGEFKLVMAGEIFEKEERIILPDGTDAIKRESITVNYPFVGSNQYLESQPSDTTIYYDTNDFISRDTIHGFLKELEASSSLEFSTGETIRKALTVDPQLIITIGTTIWATITGSIVTKKVIDKVGEKLADKFSDDLLEFYALVRSAIIGMAKYTVPRNRRITYIIRMPTKPSIELVAQTNDAETVLAALHPDSLRAVQEKIELYQESLQITMAQFLLSNKGDWSFNYLLTENGQVIGRKRSFRRKIQEIDLTTFQNKGMSISLIGKHSHPQRHNSKNTP